LGFGTHLNFNLSLIFEGKKRSKSTSLKHFKEKQYLWPKFNITDLALKAIIFGHNQSFTA
jgi:hypothetical protein